MKTDLYCYMQNRDRLVLPQGVPDYEEAFDTWLDPDDTAVIEIDMHRGHVGPDERLNLPC